MHCVDLGFYYSLLTASMDYLFEKLGGNGDEQRPHTTMEGALHAARHFPTLAHDHDAHALTPAHSPTLLPAHAHTTLPRSRCARDPITSAVQYRHCSAPGIRPQSERVQHPGER